MGESTSIAGNRSIAVAATSRRNVQPATDRGDLSPQWFARMCRVLWQRKCAAHLHLHTHAPERTCRDWASGATEPSAAVLAGLLRSHDGGRVLEVVMSGAGAQWWRELRRARIIADAYDAHHAHVEQQLKLAFD